MKTFPDATVVVTHRDPVAVTASMITMIAYTSRLALAKIDLPGMGRYWSARIEDLLRACVADRDLLPGDRSLDVRFAEFMADDVAMVERIYHLAGQPMTVDGRAAMQAFMAAHPRGRHGRVAYDLTDFGLEQTERRQALAFYADRFGVDVEAVGAG